MFLRDYQRFFWKQQLSEKYMETPVKEKVKMFFTIIFNLF